MDIRVYRNSGITVLRDVRVTHEIKYPYSEELAIESKMGSAYTGDNLKIGYVYELPMHSNTSELPFWYLSKMDVTNSKTVKMRFITMESCILGQYINMRPHDGPNAGMTNIPSMTNGTWYRTGSDIFWDMSAYNGNYGYGVPPIRCDIDGRPEHVHLSLDRGGFWSPIKAIYTGSEHAFGTNSPHTYGEIFDPWFTLASTLPKAKLNNSEELSISLSTTYLRNSLGKDHDIPSATNFTPPEINAVRVHADFMGWLPKTWDPLGTGMLYSTTTTLTPTDRTLHNSSGLRWLLLKELALPIFNNAPEMELTRLNTRDWKIGDYLEDRWDMDWGGIFGLNMWVHPWLDGIVKPSIISKIVRTIGDNGVETKVSWKPYPIATTAKYINEVWSL